MILLTYLLNATTLGDDLLFGPSDTTPASERTVRIQTPENVVERIEQTGSTTL